MPSVINQAIPETQENFLEAAGTFSAVGFPFTNFQLFVQGHQEFLIVICFLEAVHNRLGCSSWI